MKNHAEIYCRKFGNGFATVLTRQRHLLIANTISKIIGLLLLKKIDSGPIYPTARERIKLVLQTLFHYMEKSLVAMGLIVYTAHGIELVHQC